jgi:hypothetical protein
LSPPSLNQIQYLWQKSSIYDKNKSHPVSVIKINVTNITNMTTYMNIDIAMYHDDDVTIMTHLFIDQYQN